MEGKAYQFESFMLLVALEEYVPYMTALDLEAILYDGLIPTSATILRWEIKKGMRVPVVERKIAEAMARQK